MHVATMRGTTALSPLTKGIKRSRLILRSSTETATKEKYLETLARPDSIVSSWVPQTIDANVQPNACWKRMIDLEMPEGRCVGVQLLPIDASHPDSLCTEATANPAHWIHKMLHPQEVSFALAHREGLRESFLVGRLAMREALRLERYNASSSILKDEHGRPIIPKGYFGSISHKDQIGVALLRPRDKEDPKKMGVGVDIEQTMPKKYKIGKKVLTEAEQKELGHLEVGFSELKMRKLIHANLTQLFLNERVFQARKRCCCDSV